MIKKEGRKKIFQFWVIVGLLFLVFCIWTTNKGVFAGEENKWYEVRGVVINVIDGDTIRIKVENGKEEDVGRVWKVRLWGIDTPESWHSAKSEREAERCNVGDWWMRKNLGKKAKEYLKNLLLGKEVIIRVVKKRGYYGRVIGIVYFPSSREWIDVNQLLVEEGYACAFKRDFGDEKESSYLARKKGIYIDREIRAMNEGRGLWHKYGEVMKCLCGW